MKIKKHPNKYLVFLLASLFFGQAVAQYEIKKHSINNGSTTVKGSDFEMRSSVAQVDVSKTLVGVRFELTGGFWTAIESPKNSDLIFEDGFE